MAGQPACQANFLPCSLATLSHAAGGKPLSWNRRNRSPLQNQDNGHGGHKLGLWIMRFLQLRLQNHMFCMQVRPWKADPCRQGRSGVDGDLGNNPKQTCQRQTAGFPR
eukprot:4379819-Amphidinium_carterae.1